VGFESDSERIPRGLPLGKRANPKVFFLSEQIFPACFGGQLQFDGRASAFYFQQMRASYFYASGF
jgi:hypothetical protein